jgi:hypothetical protein
VPSLQSLTLVDAPPVVALNLLLCAVPLGDGAVCKDRVLVAAIHAVSVAVAHPAGVDAAGAAPILVLLALKLALGIALALL